MVEIRTANFSNIHYTKIALMMEAARTSETLVNFYQTTRRYNPEDSHLRHHRREKLKSYLHYTGYSELTIRCCNLLVPRSL
jgi:hypothetical protein